MCMEFLMCAISGRRPGNESIYVYLEHGLDQHNLPHHCRNMEWKMAEFRINCRQSGLRMGSLMWGTRYKFLLCTTSDLLHTLLTFVELILTLTRSLPCSGVRIFSSEQTLCSLICVTTPGSIWRGREAAFSPSCAFSPSFTLP